MSVFRRGRDKRHHSDTPGTQSLGASASVPSRSVSPSHRPSLPAPLSSTSVTVVDSAEPSVPSIKQRFTSSWAQKRRGKDDASETQSRGPLGLRLLHASSEPLVDLIFVHGLRGGSVKTWQKGRDPRFFWPQFWLPMEPEFRNVNVHSFGYDADWASSKSSILNVHDFGQSLLEEMRNSPYLRENANAPIVLLGHSMGGLVIKKAFILSREVPELQRRIRCIFFLATPHKGSDYAATLNRILTASGLINDDFGRCASGLSIFSFYETLEMSIGISSAIIVEKGSAVLGPGFRNERVQYLNANHKDMCKFDGQDDPNYLTLKNALTGAVHHLLEDVTITKKRETNEQMKLLKSYLGISDRPDEQYHEVDGSCRWIDAREDFQEWRDSAIDIISSSTEEATTDIRNTSIFWVHANPGTGKTYLASHVISELQGFQLDCAYHFFHVGSKHSCTLGGLLRSISYQMAMLNTSIRERLVGLCRDGSTFDMDDAITIWNKVFKKGIFQARIYTPQYWVIDAIDECLKYQELFTLLKSVSPNFPLRIFITSRKLPDMLRLYRPLENTASLTSLEIPEQDSLHDIERYVQSRIENLPIDTLSDRQELGDIVLRRSSASFLWVRLVLDELEQVYSEESILQVLEGIPMGMLPYYERTTKAMSENKLEKHISKAVLVWVVASCRKLTVRELSTALELDINAILPSAKSAVEGLCGQLVRVDGVSGIVDVIHPTAREFLLSPHAGEFAVFKAKAHERIALTCLKLLSSIELQPPRNRRLAAHSHKRPEPSALLDYALTQFSEHIYSASAETDDLLLAIDRFFRTNVLSWVERISRKGELHCLIRTSKNLRAYLDRRAKYRSPLSGQVKNIDGWSMDLSRLVTKFGAALLQNPSSIYFLIPPLCPSKSAISQQFGSRPDGLTVMGSKSEAWDDCVASVDFGDDVAADVSCGESLIAVGMESGEISLYNHRSCQREGVLNLKYPVDLVHFTDTSIAACTTRMVTLRTLDGSIVWETRLRFRCILLTSTDDAIVAVTQHGHVLKWDVLSGALLEDQKFVYRHFDSDSEENALFTKAPSLASISPDMDMLALGYRGGAVCLWELESGELVGWARDEEDRLASKLLFNPNPDINLLLVIYTNHDLSLYDSWSGALVNTYKTPNDVGLLSASSSPDGRTLATTDMHGNLQIWDFSSLGLLYHVLSPFPSFRILHFTSDGSSIADVMDSGMRIWSPAALVRKNIEEDHSVSDDAPHLTATEGQYESLRTSRITCLCAHPSLPIVFAGKYNGQVLAFSTRTGKQTSILYSHPSTSFLTDLAIGRNDLIASSDVTGAVQVWRLIPGAASTLKSGSLLLQRPSTAQVRQICFSGSGEFLLVATTDSAYMYSMADGTCTGSLSLGIPAGRLWRWIPSSSQETEDFFLLIGNHSIQRYKARAFPGQPDNTNIQLQYKLPHGGRETNLNSALIDAGSQRLVLEVQYDVGFVSSSMTFIFDLDGISSTTEIIGLKPIGQSFTNCCKRFLGICQRTHDVMFLHRNSWVSSIGLKDLGKDQYKEHFFVPNEYISTSQEVLPVKTAEDDVVFCLYGELSIVKNGTRFREIRVMEADVKANELGHGILGS